MARRVMLLAALALCGSLGAFTAPRKEHVASAAPGAPRAGPIDTVSGRALLVNISKVPKTVEVSLTAAPVRLSMMPGVTTSVLAYNGRIPGPTLDVREGDHVIVHFRNELDEPTTVHWHGIHLPASSDGSPFNPIAPGETHDYVFTIPYGTAGTYWYHPHPDHRTGYAIAIGLFGGIVVHAAHSPLPAAIPEKLLILSDNRFKPDGSVDFPDMRSQQGTIDDENGREGNVLFVNGEVNPTFTIRSGEVQRWRIINASAARVYRLVLSGHTFLHVGSDGGLFEKPIEVKDILLATGERVELLVRGTDAPGGESVLQTLPYDRYAPQTRPKDWQTPLQLLTLRTTNQTPVKAPAIPSTLRVIPALDTTKVTAVRTIVMSQGLINGRTMDMNRVDITAPLGATEIWKIENIVGMDHPFHLHGFQFQVLDRNGVPEKYRSWKDMIDVPKHETARIIVRYDDFPGKWMFHCHILNHEDMGMMGVLEVK